MAHHTAPAGLRPNGTYAPTRLQDTPAKGDTVALYGMVGTVVATTAVRNGHRAIALRATCRATGQPVTLYAAPPAQQETGYYAAQPVPQGHYYGGRGAYGQDHV